LATHCPSPGTCWLPAEAEVAADGDAGFGARKQQAAEEALAETADQDGEKDVVWRINYEEINRRFRWEGFKGQIRRATCTSGGEAGR
jgi:hypothetical protein